MTDEQLSEFAEFLDYACKRSGKVGRGIDYICPLGAAAPETGLKRPIGSAARLLKIPQCVAIGFAAGFDGERKEGDSRAFELGRNFADQYRQYR